MGSFTLPVDRMWSSWVNAGFLAALRKTFKTKRTKTFVAAARTRHPLSSKNILSWFVSVSKFPYPESVMVMAMTAACQWQSQLFHHHDYLLHSLASTWTNTVSSRGRFRMQTDDAFSRRIFCQCLKCRVVICFDDCVGEFFPAIWHSSCQVWLPDSPHRVHQCEDSWFFWSRVTFIPY